MRWAILIVILLVMLAGCEPAEPSEETETPEEPEQEVEEVSEARGSGCDSYSSGPRKTLCYAMEKEDITMCAGIEGRFREECVLVLAEMVHDTTLVTHCGLSEVQNNIRICRALISEDIEKCFLWTQGEGLGSSLSMRDCIDLTSRKLRDPELCDLFVTRSNMIYSVCGKTSDCEGQWIDGASEHAEDCRYAVEEAIGND
ncbi:hypothetical protein KY359_03205 [Candidatus Woesearchaeota archaeon]|nr:hypothetical protein [Candidatus Woesearchaeota archaeon]